MVSAIASPDWNQNFADPDLARPLDAYYGANLPRLVEIKRRYDPGDRFHRNQSAEPGVTVERGGS